MIFHSPKRRKTCTQVPKSTTGNFDISFTSTSSIESARSDSECAVKDELLKWKHQSYKLATSLF